MADTIKKLGDINTLPCADDSGQAKGACALAPDRGSSIDWTNPIAGSSMGFAIVDAAQHVVNANRAFARILGCGAPEHDDTLPAWIACCSVTAASTLKHILMDADAASFQLQGPDRSLVAVMVAARHGATRIVAIQAISGDPMAFESAPYPAARDPITGLGNRLSLETAGRYMATRSDNPMSIAITIAGLDGFKQINDTLGRVAGDTLLRLVAKRLCSVVRGDEVVIRLGGEEFVILHTSGLDAEGADSVGRRVVDLLGRPFLVDGHQVHIGASVGIAVTQPGIDDVNEMLRHADLALCESQALGRGTYRVFEPRLAEKAQARRALEVNLRRALGLKELLLHYQPQVDMTDGRITGFEALIRWRNAERGMISPAEFIPLAEEIGEIHAIGRWIIYEACKEAASWPDKLSVAVNVSALQLQQDDLVAIVQDALAVSGLAPQRFEIEITENVLLGRTDTLLHSFCALREMGVGIAMDDFGTGYSSLSYLSDFPFSKLKIDQSFVQSAYTRKSSALIDAILSLGAGLGMTTTAEGIETNQQYEMLANRGCMSAQGYLISRPLPADQIQAFLAGGNFNPGTQDDS